MKSQTITFRLNEDNPNEARALEVLRRWQAEGHSTREIIMQALLMAEGLPLVGPEDGSGLVSDLRQVLSEARALVSDIRRAPAPVVKDDPTVLKASFIAGVKQGYRPGMKRGDHE